MIVLVAMAVIFQQAVRVIVDGDEGLSVAKQAVADCIVLKGLGRHQGDRSRRLGEAVQIVVHVGQRGLDRHGAPYLVERGSVPDQVVAVGEGREGAHPEGMRDRGQLARGVVRIGRVHAVRTRQRDPPAEGVVREAEGAIPRRRQSHQPVEAVVDIARLSGRVGHRRPVAGVVVVVVEDHGRLNRRSRGRRRIDTAELVVGHRDDATRIGSHDQIVHQVVDERPDVLHRPGEHDLGDQTIHRVVYVFDDLTLAIRPESQVSVPVVRVGLRPRQGVRPIRQALDLVVAVGRCVDCARP